MTPETKQPLSKTQIADAYSTPKTRLMNDLSYEGNDNWALEREMTGTVAGIGG